MIPPTPTTLEGERVRLVPLLPEHTPALWDVAQDERIWTYMPARMTYEADMEAFIADTLRGQAQGLELPFAVLDKTDNRLVGSTRYLDISVPNRRVEIGGTWYAPEVWRTRINTECKYLLMRHAFETLGANRVCLKTDSRNERSQKAIARLGAMREGILRAHMVLHDGYVRDTVYYSIIASEWPAVKTRLESYLSPDAERQSS